MDRIRHIFAVSCVSVLALTDVACTASASTDDIAVGDCIALAGSAMSKQPCGSAKSNFKVIAKAASDKQCPSDVDSSYFAKRGFGAQGQALCLDIDWVIGGCMDVPDNSTRDPIRVDCNDHSLQDKKRATQILTGVASIDSCSTALGYPYVDRNFTVCVEEVA